MSSTPVPRFRGIFWRPLSISPQPEGPAYLSDLWQMNETQLRARAANVHASPQDVVVFQQILAECFEHNNLEIVESICNMLNANPNIPLILQACVAIYKSRLPENNPHYCLDVAELMLNEYFSENIGPGRAQDIRPFRSWLERLREYDANKGQIDVVEPVNAITDETKQEPGAHVSAPTVVIDKVSGTSLDAQDPQEVRAAISNELKDGMSRLDIASERRVKYEDEGRYNLGGKLREGEQLATEDAGNSSGEHGSQLPIRKQHQSNQPGIPTQPHPSSKEPTHDVSQDCSVRQSAHHQREQALDETHPAHLGQRHLQETGYAKELGSGVVTRQHEDDRHYQRQISQQRSSISDAGVAAASATLSNLVHIDTPSTHQLREREYRGWAEARPGRSGYASATLGHTQSAAEIQRWYNEQAAMDPGVRRAHRVQELGGYADDDALPSQESSGHTQVNDEF